MSHRYKLSRREWLKAAAALSGGAVGTRLAGRDWLGSAFAQQQPKSAVVSIFFEGGFNALFSSADSFSSAGTFGCSPGNIKDVGNGLFVDKSTIGTLDAWSLGHMAAIGNRHGQFDHAGAQKKMFQGDNRSYPVQLAAAIGGGAAYKAVALGNLPPGGAPPEGGVSMQLLRTMGDVSTALGLGPIDYNRPARNLAYKAIDRSRAMSQSAIANNRASMGALNDSYGTLLDSLGKPILSIDVAKIAQAYGAGAGATLETYASKLAAAELMIRGGTNVITMSDSASGWDTHGDSTGASVRTKMQNVLPPIKTFLARIRSEPELAAMNITVILHGDFARDLPYSNHAAVLSALVIGSNVKVGTTGKVSGDVSLPEGTGAQAQMWSYLAEVSKVQKNPFGTNPHQLVL